MAPLDPERWAEVERLFELAVDLPRDQRAAFLERECLDEDLRREAAILLEHAGLGLTSVDAAIAAAASAVPRQRDPDLRWIGERFGPYKAESIIGHGGMGAVYRGSRVDADFQQQVAIKLLRPAAQSPSAFERFKRERQILARLQHPNIARLLDGGSTPDGVPYLVMEFIGGEVITHWCKRRELTLVDKLRLFLEICDAVECAHQCLIVHRDLKPGNILVSAEGTPKLLDFGIAKMLAPDTGDPTVTAIGTQVMTPEYASPEQVRGDPVTARVDVYALGLVLYELLTGQKAQKMPDTTPGTIARVVCQTQPPAPATLNPRLAGDLDNIIRMAIRKEPERRYPSVAEMARDIRLHLDRRPVRARADTLTYRAAKFLRRNQVSVMASLVVAGMVSAVLGLAYWLSRPNPLPRVMRVTQLTLTGHADLDGGLAVDKDYVYFVQRQPGEWKLMRVAAEGGTPEELPNQFPHPQIQDISHDLSKLLLTDGLGEDAPLWEAPTGVGAPRRIGDALAHTAAWSPDGRSIAFGRGSCLFRMNSDGSGVRKLLDTPGIPIHLHWSPSLPVLRFALHPPDNTPDNLWEARSDGSHLQRLLANSSDVIDNGNWIAGGKYFLYRLVGRAYDVYGVWAAQEGGPRRRMLMHSTPSGIWWPTPSPDSKRLFFISGRGRRELVRYDARRGEFVPFLPVKEVRWVGFSHDGRWVAYTSPPQGRLWLSRVDGSDARQLTPTSMFVYEPNWSPDDAWILFYGFQPGHSSGIYVIPSQGGVPRRLTSDAESAGFAFWSPEGSSVLFRRNATPGFPEQGLYLMDWKTGKTRFLPGSEKLVRGAWSPDGQHIAATDGTEMQLFDVRTERWTLLARGEGMSPPFWSKSGKSVFYQNVFEPEAPIRRTALNGKIEQMMNSRQIPQSGLSAWVLAGVAPDDAPIASAIRSNSDIYALELELP